MRSLDAVLRTLALALFGLFLLLAAPRAVVRTASRLALAARAVGEDPAAARRRVLGEPYVLAVERIRRAIPRDGEYLLVDGGAEWGPYWVRFDLAPRRARLLGTLDELPDGRTLGRTLPSAHRWVVVAFGEERPPVLLDRESFLRELDRLHGS